MELKLNILSPVHIGSGNNIEPFDYVNRSGQFVRVNFEAFAERLFEANPEGPDKLSDWITDTSDHIEELETQRRRSRERRREFQNDLNQVRRQFNLAHFASEEMNAPDLAEALMTDDGLARYRCRINTDRQYQLKEQIKTADNGIYVPGSSIKGALRTALAYMVVKESADVRQQLRHRMQSYPAQAHQARRQRNWRDLNRLEAQLGEEVEQIVFRCGSRDRRGQVSYREIHFDLMRCLLVSDTFAPEAEPAVLMTHTFLRQFDRSNRDAAPRLAAQAPVLLEALLPGGSFSLRLDVDLGFLRRAQDGKGEWIGLDEKFARLFGFSRADLNGMDDATAHERVCERVRSASRDFSAAIAAEEVRWVEQYEGATTTRILEFYRKLMGLSGVTPVRLGWGSHFMSTTLLLALRDDSELGPVMEDVVRAFEIDVIRSQRSRIRDPEHRPVRLNTFPRSRRLASLDSASRNPSAGAPFGWFALSDTDARIEPLVNVDELTRLQTRPQQRGGRGRQPARDFETAAPARGPQVSLGQAMRELQRSRSSQSQSSIREGQRVNAEVVSNDGMTVVVRLLENQNEEIRMKQSSYPQRPGAKVKLRVVRVDAQTGRVTQVRP